MRVVNEKFLTLDENGKLLTVTRTRMFELQTTLGGRREEVERMPSLSIPGIGQVARINDPVYQYQVLQTGMKLRDHRTAKRVLPSE